MAALCEGIEHSLWTSSRSLEEGAMVLGTLAEHLSEKHNDAGAAALLDRAEELRAQSQQIRNLIASPSSEKRPTAQVSHTTA